MLDKVEVLDVWCDACTGQVWNNMDIIFLEQLSDAEAQIHNVAPKLRRLTLSQNPSMATHTWKQTHMGGIVMGGAKT